MIDPSSNCCLAYTKLPRQYLFEKTVKLPLMKSIGRTMILGKSHGPMVMVRRLSSGANSLNPTYSVFEQLANQVVHNTKPADLLLPARAWKVQLIGEGADDAGGVFDDTIAECCKELKESTTVDAYLAQTPNGVAHIGNEQDRQILNSRLVRGEHMTRWKFLGILFGVAIRTKKPLNLNLSSIVWKQLCGYKLKFADIASANELFAKNMEFLRESCNDADTFEMCVPFERWQVQCWNGDYIHLNLAGRECMQGPPLSFEGRKSYIKAAIDYKLSELNLIIREIQRGMSLIVPLPCIKLFKWTELELLVCGHQAIDLDALRSIVKYRDCDEDHEIVTMLWRVLEDMTNEERELFLRFVSGRSRLPSNAQDIGQRFQIMVVDRQEDALPTSQTCFFQLRLGPYSSEDMLAKRLRYAMIHCKAIDADNYMLARQNQAGAGGLFF